MRTPSARSSSAACSQRSTSARAENEVGARFGEAFGHLAPEPAAAAVTMATRPPRSKSGFTSSNSAIARRVCAIARLDQQAS